MNPTGHETGHPAHRATLLLAAAVTLQLVVGLPYLAVPVLAPHSVVLVLWGTWLALTTALFLGWQHGAHKTLLLAPLAAALAWFVILGAAQVILGPWTA